LRDKRMLRLKALTVTSEGGDRVVHFLTKNTRLGENQRVDQPALLATPACGRRFYTQHRSRNLRVRRESTRRIISTESKNLQSAPYETDASEGWRLMQVECSRRIWKKNFGNLAIRIEQRNRCRRIGLRNQSGLSEMIGILLQMKNFGSAHSPSAIPMAARPTPD